VDALTIEFRDLAITKCLCESREALKQVGEPRHRLHLTAEAEIAKPAILATFRLGFLCVPAPVRIHDCFMKITASEFVVISLLA
jgi:hypothetical protein